MFDAVIISLLFGLLLLETVHRALSFWQAERTWRLASLLLVFASLTVLYLIVSLDIGIFFRNIIRTTFAIGLSGSAWFGWKDVMSFMRRKENRFTAAHSGDPVTPETGTLAELAQHDGAQLEATAHTPHAHD